MDDLGDDLLPNKLIPRTFRQRLPIHQEVADAKNTLAYWWYRCLALHTGYLACCESKGRNDGDDLFPNPFASLYADMGDVRLAFPQWWIKHGRKAFREQKPLKDVLLIDNFKQADDQINKADRLVLSIPLTMRKTTAVRKVSKLLAQAHAQRDPVDIWAASSAKRMIIKNKLRQKSIEQLVGLWELRHRYPDDTLFELGNRAGIELDLMARSTDGEAMTEEMERRRMTIAVSRLLKHARHLIDNAALGKFPSIKPADEAKKQKA